MKVFVTDGDNRAALAITRSLGAAGHHVVVGEKRQPSLAQRSRFCVESVVYPDPVIDSDGFVEFVDGLVRSRGIDVILPVADITTFLVTGARERFEPGCAVPFASAETVQRAANKVDIVQTAERLGVPVPRSVVVAGPDEIPDVDFGYPLVVKPRQSRVRTDHGWLSTMVSYAKSRDELRRDLLGRGAHEFPVMLQECITGPGVGVFACYHQGRAVALFAHRRLRERPPWGGVSVLSESTELDPQARDYAVRLLDEIGWHGVAMVEFKRDERDGLPKLMEINGRFWGSLQLAIDAGVDFPALLVQGVRDGHLPQQPPYRLGVRNRWFWGDVDALLLTLVGGRHMPKTADNGRLRALLDFMKLWGRDLHYESPKGGDLRPFVLETQRWILKGLGGRDSGPVAALVPSSEHGVKGTAHATTAARRAGRTLAVRTADARWLHADHAEAWDRLVPSSETTSVFQTHAWHRSWWETFGDQYAPCVVTVPGEGGPSALAPLMIRRRGRDRIVRFIGDGRADYCDFLTGANKPEAMRAMLGAVFSGVDWDVMELNNIPAESRTPELVRSIAEEAGYRVLVADQFACPTLLIEGHEDSARQILNKPSLRRPLNYFQRAGRLVSRDLRDAADVAPYLERFFDQHVGRWSGTHSPSLFLKPLNRRFYQVLTENLASAGTLLFSVVELDGEPIAFHYGFDYNGVVIWYKPSFDVAHAAHSPGLVLVRHLIGYAVGGGRRELDFTVGDEPFKRRFTNLTRKTISLMVFRDSSRYVIESTRRRVVSAVKRVSRAQG